MLLFARFRFQAKRTSFLFRVRSAVAHTKQTPFSRRDMEIYHRVTGVSNATHPGVSMSPYLVLAGRMRYFEIPPKKLRRQGQFFSKLVLPHSPFGSDFANVRPDSVPNTHGKARNRPLFGAPARQIGAQSAGRWKRTGNPRPTAAFPVPRSRMNNVRAIRECAKQPASCGSGCPASKRCRSWYRCRTTCPRGDGCPPPRTGCPRQGYPSASAARSRSPCPG